MSSGPPGAGLNVKLLIGAGALADGVKEATFTVEGGQRAILFRIGGRPTVSIQSTKDLFERAKDFNIIQDDVAITELSFSREYTAQQEAQRAQFYVVKAKQDQRQKIIQDEKLRLPRC